MKRFSLILLVAALLLPISCKNKQKGVDSGTETPAPRSERGPDLGLPIKILDAPADNWAILDTASTGKQLSIGNVYLSRVSRAMFKGQFGYLVEGDFPDGCSTLHSVSLSFEGDEVTIEAKSRRDPSAMCTQALVPFSYFAAVDNDEAFTLTKRWKSGDTTATIE
jgi:hypothetical protein